MKTTNATRIGRASLALAALLLTLLPGTAAAHQGHGPEGSWAGVVHWLSSPYHLISVVAVAALLGALLLGGVLRRRGVRRAPPVEEG